MNVLLINGSPHKNGCTNAALTEMAKVLNEAGIETTIFHIGSAPVGGCVGCGGCSKTGKCVFGGPVFWQAVHGRAAPAAGSRRIFSRN